jgi:hypothetical protein
MPIPDTPSNTTVDIDSIDQQGLKLLLHASNVGSKLSKKQADLDVRGLATILVNASGLKRQRFSLQHFMGSISIFASMVKGLVCVFDKRVDIFVHDCEIVAVRKAEVTTAMLVPRPSTGGVKRRISTSSGPRRRPTMGSSRAGSPGDLVDFETMMDLDSLCADLNRRSSVLSGPQMSPAARGKKSRSGSSVSEEEGAVNVFEATDASMEDIDLAVGPLAALPDLPAQPVSPAEDEPSVPKRTNSRRKQLKGFTPKIDMTPVEWATMLRAEKITNKYFSMTAADYAREGKVDVAKLRKILNPSLEEDTVSVAEAVELDSVIDELRVEDPDFEFQDEVVPNRQRLSVASSFAPSVRRQSVSSDYFADYPVRSGRSSSLVGEAEELRLEISRALADRHAKRGTMISFSDIAPKGTASRRTAASVFMQLLVLSSRSEIRFKKVKHCFSNEPMFVMVSDGSSSSSSDL